jgi:hypothetical protein
VSAEIGEMRSGDWACARTSEGNVVAIEVRTVPTGEAPYTVWQKAV